MSTTTFTLGPSAQTADANKPDCTDAVREVPLTQIVPNPHQPRRHFDEDALLELAESIQQHGVLMPILLRQTAPEQYEIIAGERRFRAAQLAGLPTLPAVIKVMTEREQAELSLIENLQREDLSPVETARAFRSLMEKFGFTQTEIGERIGKSQPVISKFLHLLELSEAMLDSLERGDIQEGHARALLRVQDDGVRNQLWQAVVAERLSVRETEKRVRPGAAMPPEPAPQKAKPLPPRFDRTALAGLTEYHLQELLIQKFASRVMIRHEMERGGHIQIGFYDTEALLGLVERLLNAPG